MGVMSPVPNKYSHGDVYYIVASPSFRSRTCCCVMGFNLGDGMNKIIVLSLLLAAQRPLKWPPFAAGVCHVYRGKCNLFIYFGGLGSLAMSANAPDYRTLYTQK